jgi:hypothetical protein
MKTNNLLKICAVGLGLAALPALSWGQVFSFTVNGLADPDIGPINADITIDFSNYGDDGSVEVAVTNVGPTQSQITGFYMLRPTYIADGSNVQDAAPLFMADPNTWTLETALSDNLKNFGGYDIDQDDYVGAMNITPPSNRLDVPETGTFTFYFDPNDPVDLDGWWSDVTPVAYVRWQGVGPDGNASGKGAFLVPEPSEIAGMAMLGLLGMLFLRRCLTKK